MEDHSIPDMPQDLQHPGHVAGLTRNAATAAPGASQPQAATDTAQDDTPMFDDPVIGWWENAWALREDRTTPL